MESQNLITRKIKDLPIQIIDGDRSAKYPKREEFIDSGVLFLNTTNIEQGRLNLASANYITEEKFDQIKKGRLQRGDLVMTTRGSIGKIAQFNCSHSKGLINAQMLILRADEKTIHQKFLFYFLIWERTQQVLRNFSSGAAQPQIPIRDLQDVEMTFPRIQTQRKIAAILSTYDDLIENNTRRIQILEEMARQIYEEWFVRFRFPGHGNVKIVESEIGLIPEGWNVLPIMSVASIKYGTTLPKNQMQGSGEIPVYGAGKIIGFHNEANRMQSVLITGCRGSCGEMTLTKGAAFITNNSLIFDCPNNLRFFLYQHLKRRGLKDCIGGAAQPQITLESISRVKMFVPSVNQLEDFDQITSNFVSLMFQLERKNENLRTTRDLLLPKLISGEIDVSSFQDLMSD
jgi:type I restriction enzyme S subunit